MPVWCQLSILSDEVSQDLGDVIRFAQEFGLDGIELRSLGGKAFRDLSLGEIREVRLRCEAAGLLISGCATPVFKCEVDSASQIAEHLELFRRAAEMAHELRCSLLRVFTFLRRSPASTADELRRAADAFSPLVEVARAAGVKIGVENEASCIAGSGREMREFLGHLSGAEEVGVVWDPCNVLFLEHAQRPFPEDYAAVAERVVHVHVKDARREHGAPAQSCVELGQGELDWAGQFTALRRRGYRGWITLETHWRAAALDPASQHLPAGHAFSAGAEAASRICLPQLRKLLEAA